VPRFSFYLHRPSAVFHRIGRSIYERRHPGQPWLAPEAIRILEKVLRSDMTGLEWGSGRSTAWLARRIGSLTSIESDPDWFARVRTSLAEQAISNVDLRLVTVPASDDERTAAYWTPNAYAMAAESFAGGSLDLVLVDGFYRQNCVGRVLGKIAPGGYLVIDQSDHLADLSAWGVPPDWTLIHHGRRMRDTTIWRRPES